MARTWRGTALDGEELFVKEFRHLFAQGFPAGSFVGTDVADNTIVGPLAHQLQTADDIGSRHQTAVSNTVGVLRMNELQFFGWRTPVAIAVFLDDAILAVFRNEVLKPLLDIGIAVDDGLSVAILPIEHVTGEGQSCWPRHVIREIVPERGGYVGNAAVRALRLADVAHPLGVEPLVVEEKRFAQTSYRAVAQPRLAFVTLRTVDRHTLIVVDNAPESIVHHLI